jgi:hypothetical protein
MQLSNYFNRVLVSSSLTALLLSFQFVALNISQLSNFYNEIFQISLAVIFVSIFSSIIFSFLIRENKLTLVIASQMGAIFMIGAIMYFTAV